MAVEPIPIPDCEALPEFPDLLEVVLPGGITISQIIAAVRDIPNQAEMGINLLQLLQPALSPLIPFFDVIDTIIAVFNCITAIKDGLIAIPPDPSGIVECFPALVEKIDKLLALLPILSVPILAAGLLDVLISTLRGVRTQLLALQAQLTIITSAIDRADALGDAKLTAIAECARDTVDTQTRSITEMLASLGNLIVLANALLALIDGPVIPDLGGLVGTPIEDIIEPLDDLILELQAVRDLIVIA